MTYIKRDIAEKIIHDKTSYIQLLIGPRQCGKSTLFQHLGEIKSSITFDDLQVRELANRDPAFFLEQYDLPLLLDEVQYVPNIFPEMKRLVDFKKAARLQKPQTANLKSRLLLRLTGSNQLLLDLKVKESLVGRASYYYLNTLSVHEITQANPDIKIGDILFKGGWPEFYIDEHLNIIQYLNDYIRNYLEKDVVISAGIIKQREFLTVLKLLAARTATFINYADLAKDSGVKSATVAEWVAILERMQLVYLVPTFAVNLNKRLIKAPKFYFLDTGIAVRLQGWLECEPMLLSPQLGQLFETLVLGELVRFSNNSNKNPEISTWRTRDGAEIDFVIKLGEKFLALDAKAGHAIAPIKIPHALKQDFPDIKQVILVSFTGIIKNLSPDCIQVPIKHLYEYLNNF